MSEPLVAIPPYRLPPGRVEGWASGAYAVPEAYIHAVRRAGLEPVVLPGGNPEAARLVLKSVHALMLIGGGDVEPGRYGAEPHPDVYGLDPERDAVEIDLLHAALADELPVLAVCRGAQVVNVA